jgi:hypothetical protein
MYHRLPRGFASWVFDNVLYPTYGNIVSDCQQSFAGRDFWFSAIGLELHKGNHVYALELTLVKKKNILEVVNAIPIKHLDDVDQYYSLLPNDRGTAYRIMLSEKPLTI